MRPENIEVIRLSAQRALGVVKAADGNTRADKHFLFNRKQVITKRKLPSYYLVYFLLIDLLGFKNLGRFEKIAWSIPIDYHGKAFLLEHGKFGLVSMLMILKVKELRQKRSRLAFIRL